MTMDKFSELKAALEFLETTEFDGEWDSALVGGENGKNYHAATNANDVVVRAADDSRHASWLCDYLEAVSPVKIRALLAELEASSLQCRGIEQERELFRLERTAHQLHAQALEQRIAELERITEGVDQLAIDGGWTARGMSEYAKSLEAKLATPVRLSDTTHHRCRLQHADDIRAAGFTVEGDA